MQQCGAYGDGGEQRDRVQQIPAECPEIERAGKRERKNENEIMSRGGIFLHIPHLRHERERKPERRSRDHHRRDERIGERAALDLPYRKADDRADEHACEREGEISHDAAVEAVPFERVHIFRAAVLAHVSALLCVPVENFGAERLCERKDEYVKDRADDHIGEIADGDRVARHAENDADGVEVRRAAGIHARGHRGKLPSPREAGPERPSQNHNNGAHGKQQKRKRDEHRLCEPPYIGEICAEHQ